MAGAVFHQLLYRSFATEKFNIDNINQIIDSSNRNNGYWETTGMLFYRNGIFIQLIEGYKEKVYCLFDKIAKDPRHSNLRIFWEAKVTERSFPNYSMCFRNLEQIAGTNNKEYDFLLDNAFHTNTLNFNPNAGLKLFADLKS